MTLERRYSVELNKAVQQEACEMYAEAIKTYSDIVKNKNYAAANRLRVNMGNIYFKLGQYAKAIKFYRMALDQVHTMISKSSLSEKSIISQG